MLTFLLANLCHRHIGSVCRHHSDDLATGHDVRTKYYRSSELNANNSYSTGAYSLTNGGPAGTIWVFLGVCVTMFTVVLSMAEMASM
jgi:hypothetical protein